MSHTQTAGNYCLEFKSDWHVGTGAGHPGVVDRLIARDSNGLPFVPAKTMTGLWRDGCEKVASALDGSLEERVWSRWVEYLFGDQPALHEPGTPANQPPREAAFRVGAARYGEPIQAAIGRIDSRSRARLLAAMTHIRPGIKINSDSGTALDQHLRFVEMGRAGSVLRADCELIDRLSDKEQEDVLALLVAGAALVERLGGKRRRGSGRCSLRFQGDDLLNHHGELPSLSKAIQRLSSTSPSQPPQACEPPRVCGLRGSSPPRSVEWVHLSLRLKLHDPMVIAKHVVGNVVESLDFLPGTILLAPLAKVLESILDDRDHQVVRRAIVADELRVLPATLEVDDRPGRPVPVALFRHKHGGGFERTGTLLNRLVDEEEEGTPIKNFRGGYVGSTFTWSSLYPTYRNVETVLRTHNTIDDLEQRPTTEVGGVFSYEAIAPGTVLRSELRIARSLADRLEKSDGRWGEKLQQVTRLGRSQKDDYGRVDMEVNPFESEIAGARLNLLAADHLVVWLLSDTLVRGRSLRFEPTPKVLMIELEKMLPGVQLAESRLEPGGLSAAIATRRTESWHVPWGKPRPTLMGLAAGSCMVYRVVKGGVAPEQLAEIEASGIGERRAEGYGRVCFNDPLLAGSLKDWKAPPEPPLDEPPRPFPEVSELDRTEHEFARLIEREAWRDQIRRAALRIADDRVRRDELLGLDAPESRHRPGMAQLQALRQRLNRSRGDLRATEEWITELLNRDKGTELWPPAALKKWLSLIAGKNDREGRKRGSSGGGQPPNLDHPQ